jgi:hypothetical protein
MLDADRSGLTPLAGFVSLIGQSEHLYEPAWCGSAPRTGRIMIATCANPACNIPFHYFRSGQIFMIEANDVDPRSRTDPPRRRIEYFWLCGQCAPTMHLMRTADGAIIVCRDPRPSDPAAARRVAFAREVTPWIRAPKVGASNLAKAQGVESSVPRQS